MDDVKTMNQMMQYARCVTIRDMQVKEKEDREAAERDRERRLDIMMEINRLKMVKFYDDAETERTRNRIKDRSVITVQIDARKKEREDGKTALRKEAEEMLVRKYASFNAIGSCIYSMRLGLSVEVETCMLSIVKACPL